MGKKISELDPDSTPSLSSLIETERDGASFHITLEQLLGLLEASSSNTGGGSFDALYWALVVGE